MHHELLKMPGATASGIFGLTNIKKYSILYIGGNEYEIRFTFKLFI